MTPIQQSYISGIDFALGEVEKTLDIILTDPNTSIHPKFSFLETIKELVIYKNAPKIIEVPNTEGEAENIKLKAHLEKYEKMCADILSDTKAKKVRSRIWETINEIAKL